MPGPRPASIKLSEDEQAALERLLRRRRASQQAVLRARILLLAAEGLNNGAIANRLSVSREMVQLWRRRWLSLQEVPLEELSIEERIQDRHRPGCPGRFTPEQYTQIMTVACEPPEQSDRPVSQWSIKELVDEVQKRGIVSSISERQMRRFLQRSGPQTAPDPLLAGRSSR